MNTWRMWGALAGLSGASAVMIAAWISHGLASAIPADALTLALARAHSASQQHLVHTLALLGVALWCKMQPNRWLDVSAILLTAGIVLFSFGIYTLHLWWPALGQGSLRAVVQVGGMAFILGWLALVPAALQAHNRRADTLQ